VIKTYVGKERVKRIPEKDGKIATDTLGDMMDEDVSCVIVQHPNFFGVLEDIEEIGEIVHKNGALYIASPLPISLGVLEPPGDYGADIVACEGQTLGIPQHFGGPYLGIFATKREYMRKMPGRIIGETIDREGKRGFVMTLQTREQHIRREKATSNICTNESLCAIRACVYMALMGKEGMRRVGELCVRGAHILAEKIKNIPGFDIKYRPFFNEFVVLTPVDAELIVERLAQERIFVGIPLKRFYPDRENELLTAVTEKRTDEDIDYFVKALGQGCGQRGR
jgi:glycine dehydrogenase subunit 1